MTALIEPASYNAETRCVRKKSKWLLFPSLISQCCLIIAQRKARKWSDFVPALRHLSYARRCEKRCSLDAWYIFKRCIHRLVFLKRAVNTARGGDGAAKDTAMRTSSRGRHSLATVASLVPLGEASSKIDESSVHCQSRRARLSSATDNIGLLIFKRVRPRIQCFSFNNSRYRRLGRLLKKLPSNRYFWKTLSNVFRFRSSIAKFSVLLSSRANLSDTA